MVVVSYELFLIHRHQTPFLDDEFSAYNCVINSHWRAEQEGPQWIVKRTGVIEPVEIDGREIGTFPRLEGSNVVPSQHRCTSERCDFQRLPGRHERWCLIAGQ